MSNVIILTEEYELDGEALVRELEEIHAEGGTWEIVPEEPWHTGITPDETTMRNIETSLEFYDLDVNVSETNSQTTFNLTDYVGTILGNVNYRTGRVTVYLTPDNLEEWELGVKVGEIECADIDAAIPYLRTESERWGM